MTTVPFINLRATCRFETVSEDNEPAEDDAGNDPYRLPHPDKDTYGYSAGNRYNGQRPQYRCWYFCSQRTPAKLIQTVTADPHTQEEGQHGPAESHPVKLGRQSCTDEHVGKVPSRVR